ncbi:MAG: hypothetical protein LBD30_07765 [Verrucomicrobiales bacterium]|jgi:3-phosphoglycerate kinase|nr:hypothetical protein [Verrucomicrobiales bacterium]
MIESRKKLKATLTETMCSAELAWEGGVGVFEADGDFGGGTVALQRSLDGGASWTAVGEHTTLTAAGGGRFAASNAAILRLSAEAVGAVVVVVCKL